MCSHRATSLELTVSMMDWELGSLVAARSRFRTKEFW
jgi:hypothetical protein